MAQIGVMQHGKIIYRQSHYGIWRHHYYAYLPSGDYELVCRFSVGRLCQILQLSRRARGAVYPAVQKADDAVRLFHRNRFFTAVCYHSYTINMPPDCSTSFSGLIKMKTGRADGTSRCSVKAMLFCRNIFVRKGIHRLKGLSVILSMEEFYIMFYILLIIAVVVIDQISKYAVVSGLGMMNSAEVIPNFFYIHCIPNDGIAMGMMSGKQTAVIAVTSVIMAVLCFFILHFRKRCHPLLLSCIALIVGGGIGNIIDRIRLGYVIDFFEFRVWSYIFNFADICVVVGCFLVLFYVLFESKFDSRRKA